MRIVGRFLSGFFLGGIIASILTMLLTPIQGAEIRNRIQENFQSVRNEVKTAAAERGEELKQELARLQKKGS